MKGDNMAENNSVDKEPILKFLEMTKEGKFTEVTPVTATYRVLEESEPNLDEDNCQFLYA